MMTGNPLSGHTNHNMAALSGTADAVDGLADGDHIVSPTLTNMLEGIHGNGIILEEDTANGATNRSVPENLPGVCEQVTNTYTFTVTGGHAIIDGLLYAFAGGPGSSADIDITSSSDHKTGSPSALTSGQEALVVVYVSSDGGDANNIYWELGTPVTAATNTYPSAPSSFLNFPNGSLTVKQSVVLAVLRVVFSSGGGNLKLSITEINDKRAFVRPSPVYFTPVTTGAVGAVNAAVDLHTELDNLHGGSAEAGDLEASRLGALWQSHGDQIGSTTAADNQKDVLYYSGTHAARFTRSVFDRVLTSTATSITLKSTDANILLLTPGGSASVTTSGAFPAGYIIEVRNLHASNAVTFVRASSYSVAGGTHTRFVCTTSHASAPVFSVLSDDSIDTVEIGDEQVTLAKLAHAAANTVLVRDANSTGDPSFKAVTNTQILIGDGTGFTAAALSGDVTMTNAGVVTIGNDKIDSQHYAAASIDNEHLADDAVDSDELAAGAVDDAHLSDGVATGLAGAGTTATSGVINVIGGDGITANANDVAVTAAQTTITSVINAGLVVGRDAHNDIDFSTDDTITFRAANVDQVKLIDNVFGPVADSDVDLGTTGVRWKDAYIDTITTTGDVDVLGNIELGHATDTTLTRASAGDVNIEGNIIYRAGGTDVASDDIADNAITLAKMAGLARGKIIVGDASGDPAALAAGADGKILVADANGDPSWTSLSGDATLSAGALTIASTAIQDGMLHDDVATGLAGAGTTATSGVLNVIGGDGITANANDVAITAAQTTVTSVINPALVIGRDAHNDIDFSTDDTITFRAADVDQVKLIDNVFGPVADSDVDLGTTGVRWKDAYIDTITTTGAVSVGNNAVITQGSTGGQIAFVVDNDDTDKVAMKIDGANIDADVVDIIADAVTTAHVIDITADALTTGSVLNIVSDSASTATRNLVHIHNDHADASGTTAFKVTNDHANSDGAGPPVAHIVHTGLGDTLRLEAINDTDSTAPDLVFKKTTSNGNAASGELIGNIDWLGVNAGNAEHRYANMYCRINSPTAGNEYGELKIETLVNGTTKERISFQGVNTIINADGANLDTRILDFAGGDLLFADAQRKSVGFGEQPVDINASLYSKLAIGLKETSAPTATADYGKIWTQDTNELYFQDGAGTNQVIQKGGKQTIWVPAAAMYPNTTNGCSALTQVELSNGPELKVLDFDDGSDEFAQFTVAFPKSWDEGTVTFQPFWTISATGTNTVAWQLAGVGFGNSDDINTAFGTAVAPAALAHSGTSGDMMVSAESGAVTISGASVDSVTYFQINRDTSADNHASDARLIGVKIFYTTNAGNDV